MRLPQKFVQGFLQRIFLPKTVPDRPSNLQLFHSGESLKSISRILRNFSTALFRNSIINFFKSSLRKMSISSLETLPGITLKVFLGILLKTPFKIWKLFQCFSFSKYCRGPLENRRSRSPPSITHKIYLRMPLEIFSGMYPVLSSRIHPENST